MAPANKSSRCVTYILGPTQFHQGHSLGVNALEFSGAENKLFSAGRDGIVSSWVGLETFQDVDYPLSDLDHKLNSYNAIHDYATASYDDESELVFLESQIRRGISFQQPKYGNYKMGSHVQLHSDWINDIKLLSDNKSIVSCSSDLSVKLWNSKTDKVSVIGYHQDYVKCLAYTKSSPSQIVSGGLDKSIAVWDIERHLKINDFKDSTNERGSVYALARLPNIISSGGPEGIIRLFDTRSVSPITKFIGHQGNIKLLKLKNDYMLSGSADSTVKLWCLRTNRALRTFDMHDSSVWSLECPDEENQSDNLFNVFYSGDRNGLIIKTDLKVCNYDYYNTNNSFMTGKLNDNLGISTVVADLSDSLISDDLEESPKTSGGVLAIKFGDNTIWSSSSSTPGASPSENTNDFIKRWASPCTNTLVAYQAIKLLRNLSLYNKDFSRGELNDSSLKSVTTNPFEANNLVSDDLMDLVSHLSNASLYDLAQVDDVAAGKPSELQDNKDELIISPFLSPNGGANTEFIINDQDETDTEDGGDYEVEKITILNTPISAKLIRTIPVSVDPLEKIEGQSGLIRHRLLNNRRYVVTMDTLGIIKVWDLIKMCALNSFDSSKLELSKVHTGQDLLEYQFDEVINKYQTNETLPMWCKVEIKSGKLFITMDESTFSNTEIYLDQLFTDFPLLEKQYAIRFSHDALEEKRISTRVNLGRMVLKNLFRKFVKLEMLQDLEYRNSKNEEFNKSSSSSINTLDLNIVESSSFEKTHHEGSESIYSHDHTKIEPPPHMPASLPPLAKKTSNDDHKRKFKFFGKSSRSGSTASSQLDSSKIASAILSSEPDKDLIDFSAYYLIQETRSKYDLSKVPESLLEIGELELPFIELPPDTTTLVVITEIAQSTKHELFHGHLEEFLNLSTLTIFEKMLPRWCGEALLFNRFPPVTYNKINFVIEELKDEEDERLELPPITKSSNKLNAISVLRAHKIATFIVERFDEKLPESEAPDFKAYKFIELVCLDQIIPFDMTLATIKARIWKKSGDVVLNYRRKV